MWISWGREANVLNSENWHKISLLKDLIFFLYLIDKNATYGSVSAGLICIVILKKIKTFQAMKLQNFVCTWGICH